MLVSCPSSTPYVEAAEESLETAFQSFEVVSCASVEPSPSLPSLSKAAIMVARAMLRNGFEPGMGLGKDCLGNADVVNIKGNPYKDGLGYEPGMPGRRNVPSRFRADRWQQYKRSALKTRQVSCGHAISIPKWGTGT